MWDGRKESLEEQALGPIVDTGEMNLSKGAITAAIAAAPEYVDQFAKAFPDGLTVENVAKAIATYERTIVSPQSPFDRWIEGNKSAISESAKRGFVLFQNKANCAACRAGWRFTGESFLDIGVAGDDKGRGELDDFKDLESMQCAFKTPTLRNIALHPPYMHDGSEKTPDQVIDFYNEGGRIKRTCLSSEIKPLGLSEGQKSDLIAFLRTLTSTTQEVALPWLPPSIEAREAPRRP